MKKATLFSSLMPRANKEVYKLWTRSKTNSQHLLERDSLFLNSSITLQDVHLGNKELTNE